MTADDALAEYDARRGAATARKCGRTTSYRAEYCDRVIELGKNGATKAQMARALNVNRRTIDKWERRHDEFKAAVRTARDYALAWWDSRLAQGVEEPRKFNTIAAIFRMKNQFPEEYRDRKESEVTLKGGIRVDFAEAVRKANDSRKRY